MNDVELTLVLKDGLVRGKAEGEEGHVIHCWAQLPFQRV